MLNERSSMISSPLPGWGEAGRGADDWHAIDPVMQFASSYVGMGNNPVIGVDPDGTSWEFHGHQHYQQGYVDGEKVGDPIPGEIHGYWYWSDYPTFAPTGNFTIQPGNSGHSGGGNNGGVYGNSGSYNGPRNPGYNSGKNNKSNDNASDKVNIDEAQKAIASFLRYSPILGLQPNPFYMAEAIIWDIGPSVFGNEFDVGQGMILAGADAGLTFAYCEGATGVGTDCGGSLEVTRIDFIGDINFFDNQSLAGDRYKIYGGAVLGEGLSAGIAVSWSFPLIGGYITGITYQIGYGGSTPFAYGGYNSGNIDIKPRP